MIYWEQFPLKNISLWFLLIGLGIVVGYVVFIALISIGIGLNHLQQDGFWIPILAGTVSIVCCLCVFILYLKFFIIRIGEKEGINIV